MPRDFTHRGREYKCEVDPLGRDLIRREENGRVTMIPADTRNRDYRKYLEDDADEQAGR